MSAAPLAGYSKKSFIFGRIALESTLPPHSDGAARPVSKRIESCFYPHSEFLLHDLLACPSPVQDESGPHGSRAGRKTAVAFHAGQNDLAIDRTNRSEERRVG